MQLAAAEAFSQAVATHFPSQFVRPALQQAPSLGGAFVARRPRSVRRYFKYTRTPDVEVTAQVADAIPTFGGSTLGAVLRAAGASFPVRARMHIYQAAVGTTLPRMMRVDRRRPGGRRFGRAATRASAHAKCARPAVARTCAWRRRARAVHEVTASHRARASASSISSRQAPRACWRFRKPPRPAGGADARVDRGQPSQGTRYRRVLSLRNGIADAGDGDARRTRRAALLQALMAAYKGMDGSGGGKGRVRILREDGEDFEDFAARLGKVASGAAGSLKKRLRAWVLPALAAWVRTNAEAFARAAAAPEDGVTIRVRLTGVPGLDLLGRLPSVPGLPSMPRIPRATPSISITVTPGGPKR
jgi:hypothetical protein